MFASLASLWLTFNLFVLGYCFLHCVSCVQKQISHWSASKKTDVLIQKTNLVSKQLYKTYYRHLLTKLLYLLTIIMIQEQRITDITFQLIN